MIKKFLSKYTQFAIKIQRLDSNNKNWKVDLYDKTYSPYKPVFTHCISDATADAFSGKFETLVMAPIENWYEELEARRKNK